MIRHNYPLSSLAINDFMYRSYEDIVSLIGFEAEGQEPYSGLYDRLEASGIATLSGPSGILHIGNPVNGIGPDISNTSEEILIVLETHYKVMKYREL